MKFNPLTGQFDLSEDNTTVLDARYIKAEGAAVFNETGAAVGFRFEGDTATYLFHVDGANNSVKIGTTVDGAIADFRNGEILIHDPTKFDNDTSFTFKDATDTNNNSLKTGSDGTFLFDIGSGNSVKIKGGDSAGAETFGYTDTAFDYEWQVSTLGRSSQKGGALINTEKQDSDFRVSGVDDTDLLHVDASTNSVLVNTSAGDGDAKFWVANGVARFDENFKFKKGSGEQVIVRQNTSGSGATGYDLKFECGNSDMMNMRGSGKLEFGNGSLSGGIVFNENGNDTDIRFEGDTDASLLATDASTDRVGIGTAAPNNKLDVVGTIQADGLRLDVTPTSETITPTHTITVSLNGTNYKIACVAA